MAQDDENDEAGEEHEGAPTVGLEISWLGYYLSIDFYPGIKTHRQAGALFSAKLADVIEIERVALESNEWTFGGGGTCDGIEVVVEKQKISLAVHSPRNVQDFYESRNHLILKAFKSAFSPDYILRSSAMATGLIDVSGDARFYLGGNLMLLHPKKFEAIARPLQILGVRMYFPPGENEDWVVEVRAESWGDEPTKLFVSADADFRDSRDWDDNSNKQAVESMAAITNFMKTRLMTFLHQSPLLGFDDAEDDNGN